MCYIYIGTVELSSSNAPHIHCGQEVTFTCKANGTNFVSISVNGLRSHIFLRNSKSPAQLGYVHLTLARNETDPMNPLLTIFEIRGTIESANESLALTCSDINSSQQLSLPLQSKPLNNSPTRYLVITRNIMAHFCDLYRCIACSLDVALVRINVST